jgi:hypothetical protein
VTGELGLLAAQLFDTCKQGSAPHLLYLC